MRLDYDYYLNLNNSYLKLYVSLNIILKLLFIFLIIFYYLLYDTSLAYVHQTILLIYHFRI